MNTARNTFGRDGTNKSKNGNSCPTHSTTTKQIVIGWSSVGTLLLHQKIFPKGERYRTSTCIFLAEVRVEQYVRRALQIHIVIGWELIV